MLAVVSRRAAVTSKVWSVSAAPLATSAVAGRWHKDLSKETLIFRYGYNDKVKQSGSLPRISENDKRFDNRDVYAPENPWAQKRALFGQNDYIDILGEDPDMFRPSEVNYEQPEWLREVSKNAVPYQRLLMKKKLLEETDYPETNPKSWEQLIQKMNRQQRKMSKFWDQYRFANYRGITVQDARSKNQFRTKHPF